MRHYAYSSAVISRMYALTMTDTLGVIVNRIETMMKFIRPLYAIPLVVFLAALFLGAFAISARTDGEVHTERTAMLTDAIQAAPETVQQAYLFAVEHPDILAHQPCYCGCGAMGHASNLDCFVREVKPDGTIDYDSHALNCGICVDIAQDVMRLTDEGMSQSDIRAYIDNKYSPFGPSTDTPFPQV
jgi:hypothetical protein